MRKSLLVMLLSIISLTCIIPAAKADITVTVVNTWGWEDMYTFVWQGEDFYFDWPGQQMTETGTYFRGKKVYQYTFPSTYGNIIFNNGLTGTGNQTADLVVNASKPCYYNGNWYASLDSIPSLQADANIPVAILSHENSVQSFYGTAALQQAVDAAIPGDIINLSAGSFNTPGTITKALKIRGTNITNATPTIIIGRTTINVTDSINDMTLEGLFFDDNSLYLQGSLPSFTLSKCRIYGIYFPEHFYCPHLNIIHTKIKKGVERMCCNPERSLIGSVLMLNSVISYGFDFGDSSSYSGQAINCILYHSGSAGSSIEHDHITFENCIIYGANVYYSFVASNCVFVGASAPTTNNAVLLNVYDNVAIDALFSTFLGTYSDSESFELTSSAQSIYLGTDGTQVGIYGGILPYDPTPTYPQIKTMNIGSKSNSDGMLDIEIEL